MISLLLMMASPAGELPHSGLKLWGPFYVGMHYDDVRAIHPKSVQLTPSCVANVYIATNRDKLVTDSFIEAKSGFDANRQECADAVLDGLKIKYGEPSYDVKTKPEVRDFR